MLRQPQLGLAVVMRRYQPVVLHRLVLHRLRRYQAGTG